MSDRDPEAVPPKTDDNTQSPRDTDADSQAPQPQDGRIEPAVSPLLAKIRQLPKCPGVYLFKDTQGRVLYIGKAKDLRSRVTSYFQNAADLLAARGPHIVRMLEEAVDVDFLDCETDVDAMLKEARLIKDIQPPFNKQLRDEKSFPYLEITTSDDYPGVYVTRKPRIKGSKLYGPFTSVAGLRQAVNDLQKVFKFRTCELEIREDDERRRHFRPCLLHAIKRCSAPCADRISRSAYRKDIERLKRFLASKRSVAIRQLNKEMEESAANREYEKAAHIRDQILALEALSHSGDPDADVQPEVFFIDPTEGLHRLGKLLNLEHVPRTLEGFDIATLAGGESCGAMVCFIDGKPFKNAYRRFRIKTVEGIDDYAMIREVVARRYRHAARGQELFPDVILIDGGLGQLHAALDAFGDLDIPAPPLIALAKREEEIYLHADAKPIRLPRNDPGLRLLQQVRDEAHRFVQHYHHILRRKRTFDEDVAAGRRPPRPRKKPPERSKKNNS
jgi:excinuclease ABC subunit C